MSDESTDSPESMKPFMEWRCDKSGTWIDESGNQASEREASLLDSILLLTDEKRRLTDAIKLLISNISVIDSFSSTLFDDSHSSADSDSDFCSRYPELTEGIRRIVRVSKLIGEINEL